MVYRHSSKTEMNLYVMLQIVTFKNLRHFSKLHLRMLKMYDRLQNLTSWGLCESLQRQPQILGLLLSRSGDKHNTPCIIV